MDEQVLYLDGLPIRYLVAGSGVPVVLLHGAGGSAGDWRWVIPKLARVYRIYALEFPTTRPQASSVVPVFSARFISAFLDSLGIKQATLVGNSLGGLAALRFALTRQHRVGALVLAASAGLGQALHPAMRLLTMPGYGDVATGWGQTPLGAWQRLWLRAALLFFRPERIPVSWLWEQYWLAQRPGFLAATLAELRSIIGPEGQREVLLAELPSLTIPTLIIWGAEDAIFSLAQAETAVMHLRHSHLNVIPACGHLPHIERYERFAQVLLGFLDSQVHRIRQAAPR
jgi:2-hydroxy-6-oxonona-2,4-dienedioate hydrolase